MDFFWNVSKFQTSTIMSSLPNPAFSLSSDSIDPGSIPKHTLRTGDKIPAIGAGTFGSDHVSHEEVATAVKGAAAAGYRHFDCASVYGNEKEIGDIFQEIMTVIPRDELWITSKVWNDCHAPDDLIASCKQSLKDLQLDYLDLYLVHWPFPNSHSAHCDVSERNPDAVPYIHENFMKTWAAMEQLVEMGLVRNIGTSNVTVPKLKLILRDAKIKPAVNEMELHPHLQQQELFDFVVANGMVPIGYCPIGSPARPERDKTPEDTSDIHDPVMVRIAAAHGIHTATLCIKWAAQRGQIPIPFSTTPRNYLGNIQSLLSPPLSQDEMDELSTINKDCFLIKGHVFLWPTAKDWRDLWDFNDQITQA